MHDRRQSRHFLHLSMLLRDSEAQSQQRLCRGRAKRHNLSKHRLRRVPEEIAGSSRSEGTNGAACSFDFTLIIHSTLHPLDAGGSDIR